MNISIRDEKGQAIIEYILVLVVAIAIIFGGLYQLNTAFKSWAANYFGDYLSCLLEAGELPSISGTGGDAGVCNQLFKAFTLSEGRTLKAVEATDGGKGAGISAAGTGERDGRRSRTGGGGAGGSNGTPFTAGKNFGKGGGQAAAPPKKIESATYTGSTDTSNYGGGYRPNRGSSRQTPSRIKLDQRLLMDERQERTARQSVPTGRPPTEFGQVKPPLKVHYNSVKAAGTDAADTGLTIADFIRFLIIAGIVIALLLFLGGQLLQIGKSME